MAVSLDEVDIRLIRELEQDADRPNVELARIVGLSPAATLNRVRRLKEEGVITGIHAHVDAGQAGLPLQVFVLASLGQHDEAANRRFAQVVQKSPNIISADWVTGETERTTARGGPRRRGAAEGADDAFGPRRRRAPGHAA